MAIPQDRTNYLAIIKDTEFNENLNRFISLFESLGTVFSIPNFSKLNKSSPFIPHVQKCFIPKTLIKDPTKNYEYYEALGDKFLKSAFASYIVLKFPDIIAPNKITLAFSKYMSRQYQAELTRLYVPNYEKIISITYPDYDAQTNDVKDSIAEDIFESIFGAIYIWAERLTPCSGIIYISEILRRMLDGKGDITLDTIANIKVDSITQLTDILKNIYLFNSKDFKSTYKEGGKKVNMNLTVSFMDAGEKKEFKINVVESSLDAAKNLAASDMVKLLASNGYDENRANKMLAQRNMDEKKIIDEIKEFLKKVGVETVKKDKKNKKKEEGEEDVIYTTVTLSTKMIVVSFYYKDSTGNIKQISFSGNNITRFDALRGLLLEAKKMFE